MADSSDNNTQRTDAASVRLDGTLINALTGLGVRGKDASVSTYARPPYLLNQKECEWLYFDAIPRRFVDAIPNEILRHTPTVTLGGEDPDEDQEKINDFNEFVKYTKLPDALSEVIKLQRLYGGAGLVMLVDDGRPPEEEVNLEDIREIKGFVPLSRYELIPSDVTITDWRRPEHYRITTSQRMTPEQKEYYTDVKIHASRVARFDGLYLAWPQRSQNTGWGLSVLQLIWEAYKRYQTALSGMEELGKQASVFIHKIPGLFQRIASGNEAELKKRLEANALSRSVYGGVVIDTEEEVDWLNNGLGGLSGATEPFIQDLTAATGWPAAYLFGISPGGLGKEGRYEERVWASIVEEWQENYCRDPISQIFTLVMAAKDGPFKGKIPESWQVEFPTIFTETEEEKVQVRSTQAQTDQIYINLGVLAPTEVRASRFDGPKYSIETELDEDVTEQMTVQADIAFETQLQNYQAQQEMQAQQAAMGTLDMQAKEISNQAALATPPGAPTPNGAGGSPSPTGGAPQAAPAAGEPATSGMEDTEEEDAELLNALKQVPKNDSLDFYGAHGLRINVTHKVGDTKIGYICAPDGQRMDATEALMIFGPNRTRAYKLYRSRFECDGLIKDGPYVTGFARMKSAKQAVGAFFPGQNVVGLSPISDAETESLRAGWGTY